MTRPSTPGYLGTLLARGLTPRGVGERDVPVIAAATRAEADPSIAHGCYRIPTTLCIWRLTRHRGCPAA